MNNIKLQQDLCNVIRQAIDQKDIMGANLLITKDDKEIAYCQEGMANAEQNRPIQRDTIFRLYSMTKPITATAAMILMERGELELYQPVSDFLPALAKQKVYQNGKLVSPQRPMMIHDLLDMSSGLSYPDDATEAGRAVGKIYEEMCQNLEQPNAITTIEFANRLAESPLLFTPGSSWQYGTSADVLAAVIEVASEKKFSQFLQEELFTPLDMKDTAFYVPEEKQHRLAATYETVLDSAGNPKMIRYTGTNLAISNEMKQPPAYEAGGAGLASTLDDYLKFAHMLQHQGTANGQQILHKRTVEYLISSKQSPAQMKAFHQWIGADGYTYGNLMRRCIAPEEHRNLCTYGEYGWDGWLGMYFVNLPKENITLLIGMQKKDAGTFTLTRKLRNVCFSYLL